METGNLTEKEFSIMRVKMTQYLRNRMEKMQEMFTKDPEELKNKSTEMNNSLEGINPGITEAEEQISELADRMVDITATEQNIEKKNEKNEDRLRDLWDNIKCTNMGVLRVPEEGKREKVSEKIFEEIIAENFLNMGREIVNQVLEAQRVPGRISRRKNTPRHIVIKMTKTKDKDKILKATREK